MAKNPKVIIFDFDGTIADSVDVFVDIAHRISGSHEKIEAEELRSLRGLIRFGQRVGAPYWKFPLVLSKVRSMTEKHIDQIKPFRGMTGIIKSLHDRGARLFIVSSNSETTIAKFLELNDLTGYFSGIYGSRRLVKSKTRSLAALVRYEKLVVKDCTFVGDEPSDHQASSALGMRWVAVSWGFASRETLERLKPVALVDRPSELAAYFKLLQ